MQGTSRATGINASRIKKRAVARSENRPKRPPLPPPWVGKSRSLDRKIRAGRGRCLAVCFWQALLQPRAREIFPPTERRSGYKIDDAKVI